MSDKDKRHSLYMDDIVRELWEMLERGQQESKYHYELQLSSEESILKYMVPFLRQAIKTSKEKLEHGFVVKK